jgi:hypothetical protein
MKQMKGHEAHRPRAHGTPRASGTMCFILFIPFMLVETLVVTDLVDLLDLLRRQYRPLTFRIGWCDHPP